MQKSLILITLVLVAAGAAAAQDTPKGEVAGNYTYMRFSGGTNCNGGGGSAAGYLNHWFGIVGDFSACKVRASAGGGSVSTYMFGPRLSYRTSNRATPFVQALFGGTHTAGANSFSLTFGGGLDVKASEHVAIRVAQGEYFMTHFGGVRQNNFRFSAGVVFHFGSK